MLLMVAVVVMVTGSWLRTVWRHCRQERFVVWLIFRRCELKHVRVYLSAHSFWPFLPTLPFFLHSPSNFVLYIPLTFSVPLPKPHCPPIRYPTPRQPPCHSSLCFIFMHAGQWMRLENEDVVAAKTDMLCGTSGSQHAHASKAKSGFRQWE